MSPDTRGTRSILAIPLHLYSQQRSIWSILLLEGIAVPFFHDTPSMHHNHLIGQSRHIQPVGDHNCGMTSCELREALE